MIAEIAHYVAAALLLFGAGFSLIAAIGVLRLPDLYTRLHAASKAGATGAGAVLLLSTPVAAHLLARAALRSGETPSPMTTVDDLR